MLKSFDRITTWYILNSLSNHSMKKVQQIDYTTSVKLTLAAYDTCKYHLKVNFDLWLLHILWMTWIKHNALSSHPDYIVIVRSVKSL